MNFAIVGTNFISDNFCAAVSRTKLANVVAVYSRGADTGEAFAKRHNIGKVYTDYSSMLKDTDIDAVYIASPTMCHAEHAIAALDAEKHVLCEKMIAATYPEFLSMKAAVARSGKALIEAMRPDFDEILGCVSNNLEKIGKIRHARLEYCQYSSRYDRFKAGEVLNAFDPKMKNSALADIGIYPLHYAISLFGSPKEIHSVGNFLHNGFLGSGASVLNYGSFEVEIVYAKTYEGENVSKITGEHGDIIFDKINEPTYCTVDLGKKGVKTYHAPQNKSNMVNEISDFIEICNGNTLRGNNLFDVTDKTMLAVDIIYKDLGILF